MPKELNNSLLCQSLNLSQSINTLLLAQLLKYYYRYFKEMAVHYREYVHVFCCDDKCKVGVGAPGLPIAAVDRGKRVSIKYGFFYFICTTSTMQSVFTLLK